MKTIIKKTKKFFKSIWKFIDKRIVLPITKFLLKFDNGKVQENNLRIYYLKKTHYYLYLYFLH